MVLAGSPHGEGDRVLETLRGFGRLLAIKLYRLRRPEAPDVPMLPCLDHEAMLHEGIAPHAAAYVQETASGDLHEIVWIPSKRRIEIDTVSTWGEHTDESRQRLVALLRERLPDHRVDVRGPSWWRGERRVANACQAQVSLREVLVGTDTASVKASIDRLATIGSLMEKESRVASWGVRTLTGPILAAAGVVTYLVLDSLRAWLNDTGVTLLQYALIGLLGATFVYYGLKAVQLTEMANRVWKRTAEYNLILSERQRLRAATPRGAEAPKT